jgi:hypothetical protein
MLSPGTDWSQVADDDPRAPWIANPLYGGMKPGSARKSWETAQEREPEPEPLPPFDDAPPPQGEADYGNIGTPPAREAPQQPLILSSAEFVEGFVPPAYLVDGILQRGFFYSLTGPTGSGKTAVTLFLVAHVGLARSIGKHEVEQGSVLYFAGENPDDIRMRWIGMGANMDFDAGSIPVNFIPGTFKISAMAERITKVVEARGPVALVVVDTSAAYFEGDDENSNAQAGIHARRLRSLVNLPGKPTVIVNCHPPKNAPNDKLIPRGGGAFIAEVDGNMTCSKGDGGVVDLHWQGKFRGPDFAPILFQLVPITAERLRDAKGRLIPTVMARHLSDGASEEIAAAARDNENRLLQAIADDPSSSLAHLATKLGWTTRGGDPNKVMAQRARDKLKEAKLVTIERGKAVVSDKGERVLASLKNLTP